MLDLPRLVVTLQPPAYLKDLKQLMHTGYLPYIRARARCAYNILTG